MCRICLCIKMSSCSFCISFSRRDKQREIYILRRGWDEESQVSILIAFMYMITITCVLCLDCRKNFKKSCFIVVHCILFTIYSFVYARRWSFSYLWIQHKKYTYIMSPLIFYGPFIFHLTWYITSILCALSCLSLVYSLPEDLWWSFLRMTKKWVTG